MSATWIAWSLGSLLAAGCILPVSTGTPMPATTVGQGKLGFAVSGEAPVLDLLADTTNGTEPDFDEFHGAAPAAAMTLTASLGLGDTTDLEVSAEGALFYFIVPMPTGGSAGIRQHIAATDLFDFAFAARIGGVSSGLTSEDGNDTTASALYGAVQGIMQTRSGIVRPMAAINLMPFRMKRDPSDRDPFKFGGLASSATFGLMLVGSRAQFGPYVTVTNFESSRFSGGWFTSGGVMLAFRPDRNRRVPPPPPPPPPSYVPPPPYPPPGPYPAGPYPAGPLPAPPGPEPAPAPPAPYPAPAPLPPPVTPPPAGAP